MRSMLKRDKRATAGIWAGLLAVAVFTVGCGSSGGGGTTGGGSSSPAASAPASSGSGGGSFASGGNCAQLKGLALQFRHALAVDKATGADWQKVASDFQALANAAPGAIQPDLQVVSHAFTTYASTIAKLNLKPGTAPSPTQLPKIFQALRVFASPSVRAASQHIKTWVHANCQ